MTVVEKTQYNVKSQVPLLPCIQMQFLSVVAGILQTWAHICFCPDVTLQLRGMKLSKQVYEISNLLEISSDEYH